MNKNNNLLETIDLTKKDKEIYITNVLKMSKKSIIINKNIINRYEFLLPYINQEALFFENIYFSIFYILIFEMEEDGKKDNCIIYNFMIDKLNKKYVKNSLSYFELKDIIMNNLFFTKMKKSFLYSYVHLSSFEYDFNNDINEWLNMIKYEDINYDYIYLSKSKNNILEFDYSY